MFDSGDGPAALDAALEAADVSGVAARRAEAAARGRLLGLGVAYSIERSGGGPIENARIRVRGDGRIEAWIGTQSTGQGHETVWGQLIVERLGVDLDVIEFPDGDSDLLPEGGGTGGSRSAMMAHRVFALAGDDVVAKGRALAAERLEAAVEDVEFHAEEGGRFRIAGADRSISLYEAAQAAEEGEILGEGGVTDRGLDLPERRAYRRGRDRRGDRRRHIDPLCVGR